MFPVNSDLGFCLGEVVQEVQILPVGFCFSWVLLLEEYLSVNFCSCYVLSHEPSRTAGLTSVMPRILQFCSIICYRFLYYLMLNPYLFLLFLFYFFLYFGVASCACVMLVGQMQDFSYLGQCSPADPLPSAHVWCWWVSFRSGTWLIDFSSLSVCIFSKNCKPFLKVSCEICDCFHII